MSAKSYSGPIVLVLIVLMAGLIGYYHFFSLPVDGMDLEESDLLDGEDEIEDIEPEETFGPEELEGLEPTVNVELLASSSSILKSNWFLSADGGLNPLIEVKRGDIVRIKLINDEDIEHSIVIDDFGVNSKHISAIGDEAIQTFIANRAGTFSYYCVVPGHRETGMEGTLVVTDEQ